MDSQSPRILIVKLWALGDVVLATPLVRALRAKYDCPHITWLADAANADVLRGCPEIDDVISVDIMQWRRYYRRMRWDRFAKRTAELRSQLSGQRYDMVLNLHADQWWATLLNVGASSYGLFTTPRSVFRRFYTKSISSTYRMHFTLHQMLMAQLLDCPEVVPHMLVGQLADEPAYVDRFYQQHDLHRQRPLIVMSPYSSKVEKDWPASSFAKLGDLLATEMAADIVLTCAPKEQQKACSLAASMHATATVATGTTLLEYVALLRAASLVVCNDTSALHIAAAASTPVVAMFGPTSPDETAPLVGLTRILTPPDGSTDISQINCGQVLAAAISIALEAKKK